MTGSFEFELVDPNVVWCLGVNTDSSPECRLGYHKLKPELAHPDGSSEWFDAKETTVVDRSQKNPGKDLGREVVEADGIR